MAAGRDFEALGISVIPCMGKSNLDRPFLIFRALGIPTYLLWDSDRDKNGDSEVNKRLLRLVGEAEADWPNFVRERAACFETDLETTLREEIRSELFDTCLHGAQEEFGIPQKAQALKNPMALQHLIAAAHSQGGYSKTLDAIVEHIIKLVG